MTPSPHVDPFTSPRLHGELVRYRNWPDPRESVADAVAAGRHVGDLLLPTLALRGDAVEHNAALMAAFVAGHHAVLAPHGKTSMSPELVDLQRQHGAWAITAATCGQARLFESWGVPRIVIANEVTDPAGIAWLAGTLSSGPEVLVLVDSVDGVDLLSAGLADAAATSRRPLGVLLEVGVAGGRAGVRDDETARAVAQRAATAPALALRGVEAFEGVAGHDRGPGDLAAVVALLDRVTALARELDARDLITGDEIIVTAGGSAYPDVVADAFADWGGKRGVRRVIRSGGYLTHDHGMLEAVSPHRAAAGLDPAHTLQPALRLFAVVLSQPEAGQAILGFGRRDAPFDSGLPLPLRHYRRDADGAFGEPSPTRLRVDRLNDQHAFCIVDPDETDGPAVGDLVELGVSHPCTAFDKWPLVPVIDERSRLRGAVTTWF